MAITVRNYLFSGMLPSVPYISATGDLTTIQSAITTYETVNAPAYADSMEAYVISRDNLQKRFQYDVLAELGLGTIDLGVNTIALNVKANELWTEAIRNLDINTVSGMTSAYSNATRLLAILESETSGEELVITDTEDPVEYDANVLSIDLTGELSINFYMDAPNANGTSRTFTGHNDATMAWSSVKNAWVITDGASVYNGVAGTTDPADAEQIWTLEV